ncbi:MAG: hypothetical protein Q8S55_09100 [Methylococcaceae bacterium]|nr:hypothetical protein [Methylococcaceae bacterium]
MPNNLPNRPCWDHFTIIPALPLWQVVALTLDIDTANIRPVSLVSGTDYSIAISFVARSDEFKRRMQIALGVAHGNPNKIPFTKNNAASTAFDYWYVDIVAFGVWARGLGWDLPAQYPQSTETEISSVTHVLTWTDTAYEIGAEYIRVNPGALKKSVVAHVASEFIRLAADPENIKPVTGRGNKRPSSTSISRHGLIGLFNSKKS